MKKIMAGIFCLVLAAWMLLQGNFGVPLIDINFWPLLLIAVLLYFAVENVLKKNYLASLGLGFAAFIIVNNRYHFVDISYRTLLIAGILAYFGIQLLINPKKKWFHSTKYHQVGDRDVSFGSGTFYIHTDDFTYDQIDCTFGSATVYFDNAIIQGHQATFDIDASFGGVTLYIPQHWGVDVQVDNSFGSVSVPNPQGVTEKILQIKGDVSFGRLTVLYIKDSKN